MLKRPSNPLTKMLGRESGPGSRPSSARRRPGAPFGLVYCPGLGRFGVGLHHVGEEPVRTVEREPRVAPGTKDHDALLLATDPP